MQLHFQACTAWVQSQHVHDEFPADSAQAMLFRQESGSHRNSLPGMSWMWRLQPDSGTIVENFPVEPDEDLEEGRALPNSPSQEQFTAVLDCSGMDQGRTLQISHGSTQDRDTVRSAGPEQGREVPISAEQTGIALQIDTMQQASQSKTWIPSQWSLVNKSHY